MFNRLLQLALVAVLGVELGANAATAPAKPELKRMKLKKMPLDSSLIGGYHEAAHLAGKYGGQVPLGAPSNHPDAGFAPGSRHGDKEMWIQGGKGGSHIPLESACRLCL